VLFSEKGRSKWWDIEKEGLNPNTPWSRYISFYMVTGLLVLFQMQFLSSSNIFAKGYSCAQSRNKKSFSL